MHYCFKRFKHLILKTREANKCNEGKKTSKCLYKKKQQNKSPGLAEANFYKRNIVNPLKYIHSLLSTSNILCFKSYSVETYFFS